MAPTLAVEQVILCINYAGVQSKSPLERGGARPWEAVEMWLRPSCTLGCFLSRPRPQDGSAGRGQGPRLETNCPWRLRATERGGRDGPRAGTLGCWRWGSAPRGRGLLAATRLPALSSQFRHCSRSDLSPGASIFFFFLSRKLLLLLLPCSQGRQGHPLLWGGKRPSRTPLRPSLRAVGAEWPRSVLPAA